MTEPQFKPGDAVRVAIREPRGHMRTPAYVQGHCGTVKHYCGAFPNPETRALGQPGDPPLHLYRVRFARADLWPPANSDDHRHSVDVEIYEHWLSEAHGH